MNTIFKWLYWYDNEIVMNTIFEWHWYDNEMVMNTIFKLYWYDNEMVMNTQSLNCTRMTVKCS